MARNKLSQHVPVVQTEKHAQALEHGVPSVEIIQGHPAVTSLQVAESFGKDHKHVLRDIKQLLSQLPEIFIKPNFGLIEVPVKVGFGIRADKAYALSRDAFSLVVMGFTGKAALAWKVRYIEAFNAMEKALTEPKSFSLTPFLQIKVLPKARREQLLTSSTAYGKLKFPKPVRPCRSLCPSQAGDNRGVFCFCHPITFTGVGNILAEQRPGIREDPAVSLDRGTLFRLFVSNPQTSEVHHD